MLSLRARPWAALWTHGGLALAMAAGLLVLLLCVEQTAVDPGLPEAERLVVLDFRSHAPQRATDWHAASPVFFGPALKARGVPLQHLARTQAQDFTLRVPGGARLTQLLLADADVVPLMGLRALAGDLQASLQQPEAVAIDTDLLRMLWGDLQPAQALGRTLQARGRVHTVRAVYAPFGTRHPLFGHALMAGMDSTAQRATRDELEAVFRVNGRVFARLQPGSDASQVGDWMQAAFRASPGYAQLPADWTTGREAASFRALTWQEARVEGGDNAQRWALLSALGAASLLLLMLAALNAANLHAATLLQRRRETAVRRSLGASPARLLALWGAEGALGQVLATAAALLLAWWLAPGLVGWLGLPPQTVLFEALPGPAWIVMLLAPVLLWPLVAAVPALLALRAVPAQALQGRTASEGPGGRRLRQGLLTLQLCGAALLLAVTVVLAVQHRHLQTMDHGYRMEGRLLLDVWAEPGELPRLLPVVDALKADARVKGWAFSTRVPGGGWGGQTEQVKRGGDAQGTPMGITRVSSGFFAAYGMRVLAGQLQDLPQGETPVVLDAHAVRRLGFASPQAAVGAQLQAGGDLLQPGQAERRVVAVVADVKLESARTAARPQLFVLSADPQPFLTVHTDDPAAVRDTVAALWKRLDLPFYYRFDDVAEQRRIAYQVEALLAGLLAALAVLALLVAAVGAYALMTDTLRRRRTELVLRRLHGAGAAAVARRVLRESAWPLLLALALALPLAGLLAGAFLADFVDRASPIVGIGLPLLVAGAFTVLAVLLASAGQLRQALALRPVEALHA